MVVVAEWARVANRPSAEGVCHVEHGYRAGWTDNGDSGRAVASEDTMTDLHCYVPALPAPTTALRSELADWVRRTGLPEETVEIVTLATYEALANVVQHAYAPDTGMVDLRAHLGGRALTITVADTGRWRTPCREAHPAHGRGLPLMHQLAGHAAIAPTAQGTTVHLEWALPRDMCVSPSTDGTRSADKVG